MGNERWQDFGEESMVVSEFVINQYRAGPEDLDFEDDSSQFDLGIEGLPE